MVDIPPSPIPRELHCVIAISALMFSGLGIFSAYRLFRPEPDYGPPVAIGGVCLSAVMVTLAGVGYTSERRQRARNRDAFFQMQPAVSGSLPEVLDQLQRNSWETGLARRIARVLLARPESAQQSIIAVRGPVELPPRGDYRFPPEVIRSMDHLRNARIFWLIVGAPAVLLVLQQFGVFRPLPFLDRLAWRLSVPMLPVSAAVLILAGLDAFRRHRVIRILPGRIDAMFFRPLTKKSTLRKYPMEAGTVVVLLAENRPQLKFSHDKPTTTWPGLVATLCRGGYTDRVSFSGPDGRERRDVFLAAIMSTAPTPAIPDDELVG